MAWLDLQWNLPDRHDHYLMMVAAEVRRANPRADPDKVNVNEFRLPFREATDAPRPRAAPDDSNLPPGFPKRVTRENIDHYRTVLSQQSKLYEVNRQLEGQREERRKQELRAKQQAQREERRHGRPERG